MKKAKQVSFNKFLRNKRTKKEFEKDFELHPDKSINEQLKQIVEEINMGAYEKFKKKFNFK